MLLKMDDIYPPITGMLSNAVPVFSQYMGKDGHFLNSLIF